MKDILRINQVIDHIKAMTSLNDIPVYFLSQICIWLEELKTYRSANCEHEIIPIKNEVIDSGYMCVHCGKLYKEYIGPCLTTKDLPIGNLPKLIEPGQ